MSLIFPISIIFFSLFLTASDTKASNTDEAEVSTMISAPSLDETLDIYVVAHMYTFLPKGSDIFNCRLVSKKMLQAVKIYWNKDKHILRVSQDHLTAEKLGLISLMGLNIHHLDISTSNSTSIVSPNIVATLTTLLPKLVHLNISGRKIYAKGVNDLCGILTELQYLDASNTDVLDQGNSLVTMKNLPHLRWLNIANNGLQPNALINLSENKDLEYLNVSNNTAVRFIPTLPKLTTIIHENVQIANNQ